MAFLILAVYKMPAGIPAAWRAGTGIKKPGDHVPGAVVYLYLSARPKITASGIYRIIPIITKIVNLSPPLPVEKIGYKCANSHYRQRNTKKYNTRCHVLTPFTLLE